MSRSLNKAVLIGNVGADPDVRTSASGSRVASLSVATSRRWRSEQGGVHEKTEWHRVVAWEALAEVVGRGVRKGDRLYVEGRLEHRSWDAPDGRRRYATEIVAEDIVLLEPDAPRPSPPAPPVERSVRSRTLDELPF